MGVPSHVVAVESNSVEVTGFWAEPAGLPAGDVAQEVRAKGASASRMRISRMCASRRERHYSRGRLCRKACVR